MPGGTIRSSGRIKQYHHKVVLFLLMIEKGLMSRKMFHILMATALVVSTLGFTINMHFCHDELIDLALYAPAQSCCDAGTDHTCQTEQGIHAMDHCQDDSIRLEALEDFMGISFVFDFENNSFSRTLFTAALLNVHPVIEESLKVKYPYYEHSPPCCEVDLAGIQSYLI